MESSLLFFTTIFVAISLSFSENSVSFSFDVTDHEEDPLNSNQNITLQPAEWEFLWLTEAFISYLNFSPDEVVFDSNTEKQFIMNQLQPALIHEGMDFATSTTELIHSKKRNSFLIIEEDIISFRGSCIVRMLHLSLGNYIFKQALKNYLQSNEYQLISPDNVWEYFQYQINNFDAVLPVDIKTIMNSWINQDGFPVVHVEIKNNIAKLRQKTYSLNNSTDYYTNNTWWIPLTWTTASKATFQNTTPQYWLHKSKDEIELPLEKNEWVIFNVQHAGFYRVNYDEALWHRIIYALHFHSLDSISVINRASIISDAFNLAKAGIIPYRIALNAITYITRETDYLPIETALIELDFLFKYFDGQNSHELFNNFCLAWIKPSYDRLSQRSATNDAFTSKLQKKLIYWACILGHKPCVQTLLQTFDQWKSNTKISVPKIKKNLMFCIAVKHNSSLEENGAIKTILNYYSETSTIPDRAIAISSLKCINDHKILQTILEMLISNHTVNTMQKQEILYLFKAIATASYKHAKFVSNFITTHHSVMLQYYGDNNIFIEILESLSQLLYVQKNLHDYYFYQTVNSDKIINTVDTTFNKNSYHQDFYKKFYPNIVKWIKNNRYFISLQVERETIDNDEISETITRSFQFLQSFYQESSSSGNLFSLTNYSLRANFFFWKRTFNDWLYLLSKITGHHQKILRYHMLKIISPLVDKLGFEEKPDDTYGNKALRSDVIDWACRLDHSECILKSLKLFKSWRSRLHSPIPMNIQKTVFCTAIKYEADDIQFFLKRYLRTKNPHEKSATEYALGCINDVDTIQNVLSIILKNHSLHFKYRLRIISSIYFHTGSGLREVLRYFCVIDPPLPTNQEDIIDLHEIFLRIAFLLSTDEQIALLQKCVQWYLNKIPLIALSLPSIIKQAIDTSNQFNYYSKDLLTWLKSTYSSFDYHLPLNLKPIKYDVSIACEKTYFYGSVTIILLVLHDSDRIILHTTDLFIAEINVRCLSSDKPLEVLFFLQYLDGRCEIYLNSVVKSGDSLHLQITYAGYINDVRYGIYRIPLYNKGANSNLLITTHFQMAHARRAFPCFDEPSFKAKFTLRILRPNNYITRSNMEIVRSEPALSRIGWTWDLYEETELLSTYLVAFIICKYNTVFDHKNYLKYWSHHDSTPYAKYALEVADNAVQIISTFTGISLPMKKIDLIEIPGFEVLGMENWGIIVLDDKLISLSTSVTNLYTFHTITFKEFIIAHEIVHTWFGNLVTCETWEYFWLNEGFTRYFEWQVMNTIQPEFKWMDKFIVHIQQVAFAIDSHISVLPLTNPKMTLITLDNINKYDNSALIHNKAPCIIRMMHHAFGNVIFHTAVQYYLKKNQWKTVTPSKLWAALDLKIHESGGIPEVNQSVSTLMESWTSQPGYPVVHVNRTNEQLIFKQERFLLTRKKQPMELYWIPISITTKSNPVFTNTSCLFWMGSRTEYRSLPKTSNNEWIIVNVLQTGFYRVNYDVITWQNLFTALNEDNFGGIPEINRAQILDDLFYLAYADYISYKLFFTGAQYLSKERGYLPWKVFFNAMDKLYNKFDDLLISSSLKKYIIKLITPYFNEIRNNMTFKVNHEDNFNSVLIMTWARNIDLDILVNESLKVFKKWSQNPEISLNQTSYYLCIALQHSFYSDWKLVRNRYFKSKSKLEKTAILNSLGCSKNVTTLIEYIKFIVIDDSFKTKNEAKTALSSIFYIERFSIDAILNFLLLYHEELNAKYLWNKVHVLLLAISRNTYTSYQINQLTELIGVLKNKNEKIRQQLQNDLSQIKMRKQWFDKHRFDIIESLISILDIELF